MIDSSIFIGGGNNIFKFTSGLRDGFSMSLPGDDVNLNKIFTSKDLNSIYGWDKNRGSVYVMSKTGEFERQIDSTILSKAADLVVYKDNIYVLSGSKIFKIN